MGAAVGVMVADYFVITRGVCTVVDPPLRFCSFQELRDLPVFVRVC